MCSSRLCAPRALTSVCHLAWGLCQQGGSRGGSPRAFSQTRSGQVSIVLLSRCGCLFYRSDYAWPSSVLFLHILGLLAHHHQGSLLGVIVRLWSLGLVDAVRSQCFRCSSCSSSSSRKSWASSGGNLVAMLRVLFLQLGLRGYLHNFGALLSLWATCTSSPRFSSWRHCTAVVAGTCVPTVDAVRSQCLTG